MRDDKRKKDNSDDQRIDQHDPNELAYAATQFGVTPTTILQAIKIVGNLRSEVKKYLSR